MATSNQSKPEIVQRVPQEFNLTLVLLRPLPDVPFPKIALPIITHMEIPMSILNAALPFPFILAAIGKHLKNLKPISFRLFTKKISLGLDRTGEEGVSCNNDSDNEGALMDLFYESAEMAIYAASVPWRDTINYLRAAIFVSPIDTTEEDLSAPESLALTPPPSDPSHYEQHPFDPESLALSPPASVPPPPPYERPPLDSEPLQFPPFPYDPAIFEQHPLGFEQFACHPPPFGLPQYDGAVTL